MIRPDDLTAGEICAYLESRDQEPERQPAQVLAYREAAAVLVAVKDPDRLRPLGSAPVGVAAEFLGRDLIPATGTAFNGRSCSRPKSAPRRSGICSVPDESKRRSRRTRANETVNCRHTSSGTCSATRRRWRTSRYRNWTRRSRLRSGSQEWSRASPRPRGRSDGGVPAPARAARDPGRGCRVPRQAAGTRPTQKLRRGHPPGADNRAVALDGSRVGGTGTAACHLHHGDRRSRKIVAGRAVHT